jgi:hypothetical protein
MMRSPQGFACITEPGKQDIKLDTFRCGHCQRVVHVPLRATPEDMGGGCYVCRRNICKHCVKRDRCDPLEEKIERVERSLDFNRWFLEALR